MKDDQEENNGSKETIKMTKWRKMIQSRHLILVCKKKNFLKNKINEKIEKFTTSRNNRSNLPKLNIYC